MRADPTIDQMRSALRYFQVARNFKGLGEPATAEKVKRAFVEIRSDEKLTPEEKVTSLAARFKADKFQHNLSAASKLLWLSSRRPFVIYDSRAITALTEHFGTDVGDRNYHRYCEFWREQYVKHEEKLEAAVRRLQHVRDFMPTWRLR